MFIRALSVGVRGNETILCLSSMCVEVCLCVCVCAWLQNWTFGYAWRRFKVCISVYLKCIFAFWSLIYDSLVAFWDLSQITEYVCPKLIRRIWQNKSHDWIFSISPADFLQEISLLSFSLFPSVTQPFGSLYWCLLTACLMNANDSPHEWPFIL